MSSNNAINQYSEVLAIGDQTLAEGSATSTTPLWVQDDQNAQTAIACLNRNNTAAETTTSAVISCHSKLNSDDNLTEAGMILGNDLADLTTSVGTNTQNRLCIFSNQYVDGVTFFTVKESGASAFEFRTGQSGTTEGDQVCNVTNAGEWTYPQQPTFLAQPNGNLDNVTGDGTEYSVVWATEIYDIGGNFSSTQFVAPIAGKYSFRVNLGVHDIGAHSSFELRLLTSAREYQLFALDPSNCDYGGFLWANGTQEVELAASETAEIVLDIAGSTKTIDINGAAAQGISYFSGRLIG